METPIKQPRLNSMRRSHCVASKMVNLSLPPILTTRVAFGGSVRECACQNDAEKGTIITITIITII
jgi:hypothetical protein